MNEKYRIQRKHLEPATLREAVDVHLRIEDANSKLDENTLCILVKEKSLEQERVYQLMAKRRHPRALCATLENPISANQSKPRTGCFHFGKAHRFSLCPDLDEPSAKETILVERKTKRHAPSTTNMENCPTLGITEHWSCADSGSYMNIIARKHFDLLCEQDLADVLAELDAPISSRADGSSLNTATARVECKDTKRCLIVESDEDEFIIGKLLLAEMVIGVDRQLKDLVSRTVEDDKRCGDPKGIPSCNPAVGGIVVNVVDALVRDAMNRGGIDAYTTSRLYE
ncbi:hypothetical protein GN958_ATG22214, partial [Phytophthora infestans]